MRQVVRFFGLGYDSLKNELLCSSISTSKDTVMFFPGDIQNFEKNMTEWKDYSFEKTLSILENKFPYSNIIIVHPCRQYGFFSQYDRFVAPGRCIQHMSALLESAELKIMKDFGFTIPSDQPIILTGFSRGVLVLNHFLAELASLLKLQPSDKKFLDWQGDSHGSPIVYLPPWESIFPLSKSFLTPHQTPLFNLTEKSKKYAQRIKAIHYLDGHRFPTNPAVTQCISTLPIGIFIHVSPRQLYNHEQPFIASELKIFLKDLKENQVKFTKKLYFKDKPETLEYHFKVLEVFEV